MMCLICANPGDKVAGVAVCANRFAEPVDMSEPRPTKNARALVREEIDILATSFLNFVELGVL
jgi:hypothetical protein